MADENVINGVASDVDDRTVEIDGGAYNVRDDLGSHRPETLQKIEALKREKDELERENDENRERIGNLMVEIEGLRKDNVEMIERVKEMEKDVQQSESDKKAMEAVAARAVELETEVSRLQHDLITSMTEGEEANADVANLKKILEEKLTQLKNLEKEKVALREEVEKGKGELSSEAIRLRNESSERIRVEEEAKVAIGVKENEVNGLKKRIEELESVIAKNVFELEKLTKEKKDKIGAENDVIETTKREKEKVAMLEAKLSQVTEELEKSKKLILELQEKVIDDVNGVVMVAREGVVGGEEKGCKGLKLQWPAVAVSTGIVAATAVVIYLKYARQR